MSSFRRFVYGGALLCAMLGSVGCFHTRWGLWGWDDPYCEDDYCEDDYCRPGFGCLHGGACAQAQFAMCGWCYRRSNAIPDTLPLGSTVRAHYQVMQTNGEAADFIFHRHEFVAQTSELTPDGKDHVLEVAARMRSAPFPVLVERSENNSDPELDAHRRNLIAQILTDLGNPDAQNRTVVSTAYGPGYNAMQAEPTYYQHVLRGGGFGNFGSYGNNFGTFGGFGGGAGGGVGFGP
jgi:hypothetical protein